MADKTGYIGRNPSDDSIVLIRQVYQPTSIQTTFTVDARYNIGYLDVYRNGIRLTSAHDFSATDGHILTLVEPANPGDLIEVVAYKTFNLGSIDSDTQGNISAAGRITSNEGFYGNGNTLSGIVTSITAGENISISSKTGDVTITGLANTSHVVADNISVSGVTTFFDDVFISDNKKMNFGDGSDLQIYHDGSNSYVTDLGTGDLYIRGSTSVKIQNAAGTESYFEAFNDGEVKLYYNGDEKIKTIEEGVQVTGIVSATAYIGDGSQLTGVAAGGGGGGGFDITSSLFM